MRLQDRRFICGRGGTGRRARLRCVWVTMGVQVPPTAPKKNRSHRGLFFFCTPGTTQNPANRRRQLRQEESLGDLCNKAADAAVCVQQSPRPHHIRTVILIRWVLRLRLLFEEKFWNRIIFYQLLPIKKKQTKCRIAIKQLHSRKNYLPGMFLYSSHWCDRINLTTRQTWICLTVTHRTKASLWWGRCPKGAEGENQGQSRTPAPTTPQSRCLRDSSPDKGSLVRCHIH